MEEDFTKKSDEQLVGITVVPPSNRAHRAAAAELHRRQKRDKAKNLSLQRRILRIAIITMIIAGLTLLVVILQFCQHPEKITGTHEQPYTNGTEKQPNDQLKPSKTLEPLKEVEKDVKHK